MIEWLLAIAGAASTGWYLKRRRARALPAPGGPPEDRGEAVRRVLKHLQRKTIADLEDGVAAVIAGRVKAVPGVNPLRSPISDTECLGFHVDIRAAFLDSTLRLRQLRELARCVEIEVEDETGSVRIDPNGLELAITDGPMERWNPPPPAVRALLPPPVRGLAVTVEEGLLFEGAAILVCGLAVRELAATDYRDGAPTLILRASATFPLVASTDADLFKPGARPISPEELRRR